MNQFKLLKSLGAGNYGQVILATRLKDGKKYAIKQIQTTQMQKVDREAQLQEIRVLSSVFHPNVLPLFEAFIEFGRLHMVLEYCEKGDLNGEIRQHQASGKPFSEQRVWEVLLQCLAGLRELHRLGIVHRDMKPQNVFLVDNDVVRIGDLGFAVVPKGQVINESLGTPYYISPEVWRSDSYGEKCDIFSLGVIIYYMMQLKHPFQGKDVLSLKRCCLAGVYAPLPTTFSQELREVVAKMLISDQWKRPSAAELLELSACKTRESLSPTSLHQQILPDVIVQEREFSQHFVPELAKTIPNDQAMQNAMRGLANVAVQQQQYERLETLKRMADYESSHWDELHSNTPTLQDHGSSSAQIATDSLTVQQLPDAATSGFAQPANDLGTSEAIEAAEQPNEGTIVAPKYEEIQRMENTLEQTVKERTTRNTGISQVQYPRQIYPQALPNYPSSKGQPMKRFW